MTDTRRILPHVNPRLARRAHHTPSGPGSPPTPKAPQTSPPDIQVAYRILNFALRAGGAMLSCGASTVEVEETILGLTSACGLAHCEADVTFTSMTASYIPSPDVQPITAVWVVRQRSVDYGQLAGINALRSDIRARRITPEQAIVRLDEILSTPPRGQRVVLLSWAGMATAFTILLGGGWIAGVTAFVSAALVTLLMRVVARHGIPYFFQAAMGSAVATGIATGVVALHIHVQPPMVVAGGIMVLVPGYALVASVRDAITGFPLSGSAHGLEVLLTAAGILTGVAVVLYPAVASGISLDLTSSYSGPIQQVPVQVVAAGIASCLYAVAAMVPNRSLVYSGAVGACGLAIVLLLGHVGISSEASTAVAAVLIGAAGAILGRKQRTHAFLYIVPGVMPLVPGLTLYKGMLDLFNHSNAGLGTLMHALTVGLTIAAGVTLGELIIRPLRHPRVRHHLVRPHLAESHPPEEHRIDPVTGPEASVGSGAEPLPAGTISP